MQGKSRRMLLGVVWMLAILAAITSARYFVFSATSLADFEDTASLKLARMMDTPRIPTTHPMSHHPVMLSIHVAGGIVAITVGLLQFLGGLRNSRPKLHRQFGYVYLTAVMIGSAPGVPLSLTFFDPLPVELRNRLIPAVIGFASLSITWPIITAIAVMHARNTRFDLHRAWMLRSYCLTYSVVTVRLLAPVLLLLSHDPFIAINYSVLSWPLNLLVAEWLIHRSPAVEEISNVKAAAAAK